MERWEPPRITEDSVPRRRRETPVRPATELPEIWLMVGVRLFVSLLLVLAAIFEGLRAQMSLVSAAIIIGMIAVIVQTNQEQTRKLRKLTMFDLVVLVTVVPIAALNAFVAAEPGELLPAERYALLQTGGVLLILVGVSIWLATYLFPDDLSLMAAVILPGLIAVLSLTFVLHDYRNQTVLAMVAASFFLGAAAIALGAVVADPLRRYIPAAFYAISLVIGAAVFSPGLGNVFERDALIQIYAGFMILIGFAALMFVPTPMAELSRMLAGSSHPASSRTRAGTRRRSEGDSGRSTET